mgnify:FL=1
MDEYEVVTGGDQEDTYRGEKRKWLESRSSMGGGNEFLNKIGESLPLLNYDCGLYTYQFSE